MVSVNQRDDKSRQIDLPHYDMTVLVSAAESDGSYCLIENRVSEGIEVPPHWHQDMTETIYILSGSARITIDGLKRTVGPGDCVLFPPRSVHSIEYPKDDPPNFLLLASPGGFEEYFREAAAKIEEESELPSEEWQRQRRERYDVLEPPVE